MSSPTASPAPAVIPTPPSVSSHTISPLPQANTAVFQTTGSDNTPIGVLDYTFSVPSKGGPITGSLSGVCTGSLNGDYSGGEGGSFSGRGKGSCNLGFISQPLRFQFNGKIYPREKQVIVNYQGILAGISRQGSQTLSLHS